jgi:hypothetical protein
MADLVVLDGRSPQFIVSKQAFGGRSHEVCSSVLRDARTSVLLEAMHSLASVKEHMLYMPFRVSGAC